MPWPCSTSTVSAYIPGHRDHNAIVAFNVREWVAIGAAVGDGVDGVISTLSATTSHCSVYGAIPIAAISMAQVGHDLTLYAEVPSEEEVRARIERRTAEGRAAR